MMSHNLPFWILDVRSETIYSTWRQIRKGPRIWYWSFKSKYRKCPYTSRLARKGMNLLQLEQITSKDLCWSPFIAVARLPHAAWENPPFFFVSAEFHTGWMPVLNWYELIWSIKHQDFSLVIVDYCLMMTGLLQVETMLLGTATSLLCTNVCKVAASTMHCTFMSVAWESYHLRLCPTLADAFPGLVSAHEYGVQNDLVRSVLEE